MLCILKDELNMHKIRPEKSDQAIGLELQVTPNYTLELNVCQSVTKKSFKKNRKGCSTGKQNTILKTNNNKYPNPKTVVLNQLKNL